MIVRGAIGYHGQSQQLIIVGNINSNRYITDVLEPEVIPCLEPLPGALFQNDSARSQIAPLTSGQTFFSAQQIQPLP